MTDLNIIFTPSLAQHSLLFVPFGYKATFAQLIFFQWRLVLYILIINAQFHKGSLWGSGTFSRDGSGQPSALKLEIAQLHRKSFYDAVAEVQF